MTEGAMAAQVNAVMQHLDALMLKELKGKVETAVSGFESTIAMARLDASASEVRERTEAMAAATEEMSATVKVMAERAGDVRELSVSASESVATGHASMDETVQVMGETSTQMLAAIEQMDQLKTISGEIGQLLGTIKKSRIRPICWPLTPPSRQREPVRQVRVLRWLPVRLRNSPARQGR